MGKQIDFGKEKKPPNENVYICLKISLAIQYALGLAYIVIMCQENRLKSLMFFLSVVVDISEVKIVLCFLFQSTYVCMWSFKCFISLQLIDLL